MLTPDDLRNAIRQDGHLLLQGLLDSRFIERTKAALEDAIRNEVAYHGHENYAGYGMVLLCSLYGGPFVELFDNDRVLAPFEAVLGPGCIVYAYTSSSMPPGRDNYSARIHRDSRRIIPGYVAQMGLTLLLDDFTSENGATWYLPGSHDRAEAPTSQEFYAKANRLIAPAGSGLFFDANLWHAGAPNATPAWRHALTINMCRSWMKQRIDIPRAMDGRGISMSERAAQKLGFHAQVAASYDEYYAPPERRKWRQIPD